MRAATEGDRRRLDEAALAILFDDAHTHVWWLDRAVPDALLREIYARARLAPTSANCQPLRIRFVRTLEAKRRLEPCLSEGNRRQTMSAPVTAIFAYDLQFYDHLPRLFPQEDARSWFAGNEAAIKSTAFRNGTLQAAYFILAARAFGLDCGPMSGFDNKAVDRAFFPDGRFKSNFLCNLGYGDPAKQRARNPRLDFEEACAIL